MKSILGPATLVTYAADWSEYFGHQPADGSGDVYFNLDPLWASTDIDAIGIDVYWPLADWRDGSTHADRQAGTLSIYDLAYLSANLFAGEGYDWYYASPVRGLRSGDDLALSWVRRTRIGGDSWETAEVPLDEDAERYEVDILDGADVKRTISSDTPGAIYTGAEQTADFGAPQASVSLRVYQMSAVLGRGTPRAATL